MATEVDLKVGLNLEIGSVPVALDAEIDDTAASTVYRFDGSVTNIELDLAAFISYVGSQFAVDVELPPELNLTAKIDYVAGQVIYTKVKKDGSATTELGVSAKFDLIVGSRTFAFQFYADTVLGTDAKKTGNPYVIGAAIDTKLAFADLPLVGSIPGVNELALTKIGFSYTNDSTGRKFNVPNVSTSANPLYTGKDPSARDAKTYAITTKGNEQEFSLNSKGFSLTVGLENTTSGKTLQNFALPMAMPAATPPANGAPAPYYPEKTSPPSSPVHYVDVNKSFGPVDIKQIGLNYAKGEATFGISGGFAMAGFSMDLQGLTITFPLPLPGMPAGNTVSFGLDGLGFNFSKGGLKIGGGFLRVEDQGIDHYYGAVMVQFANFGMRALGGYTPAQNGNPAAFFLFVNVQIPLGGPPFLFITGLAGGFGINTSLKLPTMDTLATFPLLPQNAPPEAGTASETIALVIPHLKDVFVDEPGEYWIAAGIQFTSFEMIDAFALVTVSFGVDLQIAVLGSCSMTFPKVPTGTPPVAFIQVDLLASFTPSTGLLAVDGMLTPQSFIYGGFVKLNGGFAFYAWFSGDHEGDFVVSVGGYYPGFIKPSHYPTVPRLQMDFALGPFKVNGQAYFALTPSMMMAGVQMSAVWESGPIKAWLDAGVDFLIAWKPFHYEAGVYINIGVSADLGLFTINVHVGADLHVWGPPFGGRADVDLDVVSFTINFGAAPSTPPPVGWESFKNDFLPKDTNAQQTIDHRHSIGAAKVNDAALRTNIIKATVQPGLSPDSDDDFDWIIDAEDFAITTNSTIPANNAWWQTSAANAFSIPNKVASYNPATISEPYLDLPEATAKKTFSKELVWNPKLDIGPMEQDDVQSHVTIEVRKRTDKDPKGVFSDYITDLSITPVLLPCNTAMYARKPEKPTANDPPLIPAGLTGFRITPIPRAPKKVSNVPLIQLLFAEGYSTGFSYQQAVVNSDYTASGEVDASSELIIIIGGQHTAKFTEKNYILSALADSWTESQRNAIADDLVKNRFSTYSSDQIDVEEMATRKALTDWPSVAMLGSY